MLKGVFPIVVTPFHDDGSVDYDSFDRLIDHLQEQGAHGLGLFGNASEGYTLLADERNQMLQRAVQRVNGRIPIVASTGHTGTDAAARLSREAEDQGANALMVLPPYFLKPDGEGVFFYFQTISDAVSIPIMVQDAPLMSLVPMPVALLARMARDIPHVKSAKIEAPPTAPKIGELAKAVNADFSILGGLNGQFLIEEIERGAVGVMPSSDLTWVYVRVMQLYEQGHNSDAWHLFSLSLPLIRFELQPGLGVSAAKHNLVEQGILKSARVRHPTKALDPVALQELKVLRELVPPRS